MSGLRIRTIKPAFWSDSKAAALPDPVRLFYIGTWMLADDGGYFDWQPDEIGLLLYGYHPRATRERWVRDRAAALEASGRLVILGCGHAYVPHLVDHQHLSGATRRVLTVTNAHARCIAEKGRSPSRPAETHGDPRKPTMVREGKERDGMGGVRGGPRASAIAPVALIESLPTSLVERVKAQEAARESQQ